MSTRFDTATDIINTAAAECGITPVTNPVGNTDPTFTQLTLLLTSCGRELVGMHEWQELKRDGTLTTLSTQPNQQYDLPDDYSYMVDQTEWDKTARLPVVPASSQRNAVLHNDGVGVGLVYLEFRIRANKIEIINPTVPNAHVFNYEYITRNWVALDGGGESSKIVAGGDVPGFEPILISKFLKLRFLEAKGFDTTAALEQFNAAFESWSGKDTPAKVVNLAAASAFPYLGERNIPDTGFGS